MKLKNEKGYTYTPIPDEDGYIVSGWRFDELRERLDDEWKICLTGYRGVLFLLLNAFIIYFCFGVQRNLAYYRHIPGEPLRDVGYELLPIIKSETFRDWIDAVYYTFLVLMSVGGLFGNFIYQPRHLPRVYVMNVLFQFSFAWCLGMFFRGWTFLATSLPGPSPDCNPMIEPEYWTRKPKSIAECFTQVNLSEPNCGDLLFSGHIFTLITVIHYVLKYTRTLLYYLPLVHKLATVFLYVMVLFECYMILRARNHYTVDLFVALYVTPLWLYFLDSNWRFDVDFSKNEDRDRGFAPINEA